MPPPQGGGGGGGAGQSPTENHMAPIWIIVAACVFGYLIWYFFKGPLVKAFFYLKLGEINILNFFSDALSGTKAQIQTLMPQAANISVHQVTAIATQVGHYLIIPAVFLLIVFSVLLYFRSSTANYRHNYDMKSLLKAEAPLWPQVTPVMGKDLVKQHVEKGPWAMAMTPMQFAKAHKLLKEDVPKVEENKLRRENRITVTVIKDKAADVFSQQIGPLWQGFDSLNMHTKALFAAFAARANADEKPSRSLLLRIAASSSGKMDFSGTNELLKKYANSKVVQHIVNNHAYVMTVMASLLDLARSDGVVASADFLWLKPIDRRLWFILNTVGRQTSPAEVSGVFAHWLAEKELGRKIRTPMVQEAVNGLEVAVDNIIYHRDKDDEKEEEVKA